MAAAVLRKSLHRCRLRFLFRGRELQPERREELRARALLPASPSAHGGCLGLGILDNNNGQRPDIPPAEHGPVLPCRGEISSGVARPAPALRLRAGDPCVGVDPGGARGCWLHGSASRSAGAPVEGPDQPGTRLSQLTTWCATLPSEGGPYQRWVSTSPHGYLRRWAGAGLA
jgi:hypothetical protein